MEELKRKLQVYRKGVYFLDHVWAAEAVSCDGAKQKQCLKRISLFLEQEQKQEQGQATTVA
jgi:hypothetical protein